MKNSVKLLQILFVFLPVLLFSSCGKKEAAVVQSNGAVPAGQGEQAQADSVNQTLNEAVITYLSGSVKLNVSGEEREAETGDSVFPGNIIITGNDGYAELQFGDLGALRIKENTEYRLESAEISSVSSKASGEIKYGSVVAKVRTLTSRDAFEVKTSTAVCAVRGTEFLVSTDKQGILTVAVAKGAVSVAPVVLSETGADAALPETVPEEIIKAVPVVSSNQELTIDTSVFAEVNNILVSFSAESNAEPGSTETAETAEITEKIKSEVLDKLETLKQPEKISGENKADLKENLPEILPVSVSASKIEVKEKNKTAELTEPDKITETVENNSTPVQAVPSGDTYAETTAEISDKISAQIAGEKSVPGTAEAVTVSAVNVKNDVIENKTTELRISVVPEDAEIIAEGNVKGTGSCVINGNEGDTVNIRIRRPGYRTVTKKIELGSSAVEKITLQKRILKSEIVLPDKIYKNSLVSSGRFSVGMLSDGTLFRSDINGSLLWTVNIGKSYGKSIPVINNGKIYIRSNSEVSVIDSGEGSVVFQKKTGAMPADRFSARLAVYGRTVILPSYDSVIVLDTAGGRKFSVNIPAGTRMTPGVWENKAVIADQRGVVFIINLDDAEIENTVETISLQPVISAAAVSKEGIAVISGRKGGISAVDITSGSLLWSRALEDSVQFRITSDPVIDNNIVYIYGNSSVYALDLYTGSSVFNPVKEVSAPPLAKNGFLYLCMNGGRINVFKGTNGKLLESYNLDTTVDNTPVYLGGFIQAGAGKKLYTLDFRSVTE